MAPKDQNEIEPSPQKEISTELSTNDVRDNLADVLNKARYLKERVVVKKRDKRVAAIVPIEDIDDFNQLANAYEEMKREYDIIKTKINDKKDSEEAEKIELRENN